MFDLLRRCAVRVPLLAALWWVLTEGDPGSWVVGAPVAAAAALASWALSSQEKWRWRLAGFIRFAPFFLWHSFRGGMDVAWRVLRPQMAIDPRFIDYRLRLPPGAARKMFVGALSLLPGTLSATLDDPQDRVTVHILTDSRTVMDKLRRLEELVAGLFGLKAPPADGDDFGRK